MADTDQRTLETGRAFAESMMPGCELAIHSQPGKTDPIFSGVGTPDPKLPLRAVRDRLDPDSKELLVNLRPALEDLRHILTGGKTAPKLLSDLPAEISASIQGNSVALNEPITIGSTLSENLLLEYTNGMEGADLGWGCLTKEKLFSVLEVHSVESDLARRTPYLARAHGSNLLVHVLLSIEQAETGKSLPGGLGHPGNRVLIPAGHDTNLSNISGILDLSWSLKGYRRDETPPGGALIFSLWRDGNSKQYFVKTQFVAQTLDQLRNAAPLTISAPPADQDVAVPSCSLSGHGSGCSWPLFQETLQRAIDPAFNLIGTEPARTP